MAAGLAARLTGAVAGWRPDTRRYDGYPSSRLTSWLQIPPGRRDKSLAPLFQAH